MAQSVIRTLLREITAKCEESGENVEEALVGSVVQAVVLDGYAEDNELSDDDLSAIVKV